MPRRQDGTAIELMFGVRSHTEPMSIGLLRLSGLLTEEALNDAAIHDIAGWRDRYVLRPVPGTLMIVTWNIAYGRRCRRHFDVLSSLQPDVCLLQDVDLGCRRSGFRNVARWLAEGLEMNWVFAGEFQEIGQGRTGYPALTGLAVLSRHPIASPRVIPFPDQARWRWRANPWQPRRGARRALRVDIAGVRIYNAHVESGRDDALRRKQRAHLVEVEEALLAPDAPVVVGGDFDCGPLGHVEMLDVLRDMRFTDALEGPSYTRRNSIRHPRALDWILLRGADVTCAGIAPQHSGSDHYPVWARIALR